MKNIIKSHPDDEKTIAEILATSFPKRLKDETVFRARVARLEGTSEEFDENWAKETRKRFYDEKYVFVSRKYSFIS